ncbi:MAG: flagellin [Rubricoccaceae bacterium]
MPRPLQSALTRFVTQSGSQRALNRTRSTLDQLNSQLATGKRIQRPSDDPAAFDQARALGRLEDRLAQHERNLDAATLWTDQTQTELDALGDLFAEAREVGLRGSNGVVDRDALLGELESIREAVITRLNATSNGEYVFAGNETTTAPIQPDGSVSAGDFTGRREREIAPGVTVALNTTGVLEVDGVAAPDRIQALIDAVSADDDAAIELALDGVKTGVDQYIRLGSRNGTTVRTLQTTRDMIERQAITVAEGRSKLEDADYAEVIGALQRHQTGLEAALRATAASTQTSILNYLR